MLQAEYTRIGKPMLDLTGKKVVDSVPAVAAVRAAQPAARPPALRRHRLRGRAQRERQYVAATGRVLSAMLHAFNLADHDWDAIACKCDPQHNARASWVGPSRHLRWEGDVVVLGFGKYANAVLHELAAGPDRSFLRWVVERDFPVHVGEVCAPRSICRARSFLAWAAPPVPGPRRAVTRATGPTGPTGALTPRGYRLAGRCATIAGRRRARSTLRMTLRIAIVGGGIGGLAAALFLRRAGPGRVVHAQAAELHPVGAGIVVAPNMVRLLRKLGISESVPGSFALEAAWEFRRWADGRVLSVQPMGDECERLYGAPCTSPTRRCHGRAAARAARRAAAARSPPGGAGAGRARRRADVREPGRPAAAGRRRRGDRRGRHPLRRPAGDRAGDRRAVLGAVRVPLPGAGGVGSADGAAPGADAVGWPGPPRRPLPDLRGQLVNVVAFVPAGDWRTESWTADGDVADLRAEFAGWDPRLRQLIGSATHTKRWAIFDREPLDQWTAGRISMLGDAAHAMLPFFAQAPRRRWRTPPCSPAASPARARPRCPRRCSATSSSAGRAPARSSG